MRTFLTKLRQIKLANKTARKTTKIKTIYNL